MPSFSATSKRRLLTCDDRLQRLFYEVITEYDCAIVCGFRNQADQDRAFTQGFSKKKWPDGSHNRLPSMAVDVLPSPYDYKDEEAFKRFSGVVKEKWVCLGLKGELVWGGDWQDFVDYPHWEIRDGRNEWKPKAGGVSGDSASALVRLCGRGVAEG